MQKKQNIFMKNKMFTIYLILAVGIILIAVFAPQIATHDPSEALLTNALKSPSREHLFGTDKLGRDMFSRVIYGTRASLPAAFALVGIIFAVGSLLGIIAGYFGGWIDSVLMRLADMMVAFPGMVLAIAVAGILGASISNAVIAIALVSWTKYARMARSLVLKMKGDDYVEAARVTGSTNPHILFRYMLPSVIPTLIVTASTDIGGMMLELAGLSFLGFGARPPIPEWGLMLSEGRSYMQNAPWVMIFPGLAILIVVAVFNLLGDSLRDVLDPRCDD
ncbi:MAG TPA: ABC transporter permease [Candidatus Choladousia intestinigallinarum]|nr:ABC transporter permease [Candidatus Choladousia intestinigallinarum]